MGCIVVVDTETTGLSAKEHEVIDVWAILVNPQLQLIAEAGGRSPLLRPERADAKALSVNHYNAEEWALTQRPLRDVLWLPLQLINYAEIWLGSNPRFDVDFIKAACLEHGYIPPQPKRMCNTATLAQNRCVRGLGNRPHSLDSLCEHYRVPQTGAHTARADCWRALAVYRCLLNEVGP
jgi:DNA polymerase III epsilon subunit-like protein